MPTTQLWGARRARAVRGDARRAGCRHHGLGARNRRAAGALRRADDRGAEEARLHPDRAMSEPLQRVLRAEQAADPRRRADGLPAVARRRPCARGARTGKRRPRGRDRRRRSGDARACRHRAAVRARSRSADPARLGLPALRPRLAGAAGHGRAAGDAERASGASATSRSCWSRPQAPRRSGC